MILKYPDITQKIETNDDLAKLEEYLEDALSDQKINLLEWEEIYNEAAENMKLKRKEKMLNKVIQDSTDDIDTKRFRNKGSKKNNS